MNFQQLKSSQIFDLRTKVSVPSLNKSNEFDNNSSGWSWLERWMAAKPWENRLMEQSNCELEKTPPQSKISTDSSIKGNKSRLSEPSSVKIRKNNMTTRISAKPPLAAAAAVATRSTSSPSSEFRYDRSSASSSICTSATPLTSDRTEDSNNSRPSYMNLTESTKAKQRFQRIQRQSMDEYQFLKKSAAFSNSDSKSSAGSDPASSNISRPLCPPSRMDKLSINLRERDNYVCEY